ncbi:unnamed protein product [Linum trigynum]|uniref:Uncharacterized protein n=1 Tax=Linum trigynum TaxID=586398 RepID=A0AAV2E4H2_9ROSI
MKQKLINPWPRSEPQGPETRSQTKAHNSLISEPAASAAMEARVEQLEALLRQEMQTNAKVRQELRQENQEYFAVLNSRPDQLFAQMQDEEPRRQVLNKVLRNGRPDGQPQGNPRSKSIFRDSLAKKTRPLGAIKI